MCLIFGALLARKLILKKKKKKLNFKQLIREEANLVGEGKTVGEMVSSCAI